jgi:hypothetical protein
MARAVANSLIGCEQNLVALGPPLKMDRAEYRSLRRCVKVGGRHHNWQASEIDTEVIIIKYICN